MTCWSCERAAGDGATCVFCQAIQPPNRASDHFAVLGLPRRYTVDMDEAERRFRELSRQVHPDRFAKADPRARRASLQRSVQLNEAWRALKDPLRRAEYLLWLNGYDLGEPEGGNRRGGSVAMTGASASPPDTVGGNVALTASPALLGEILELREELADARAAGADDTVEAMARVMRGRIAACLTTLEEQFARAESAAAAGRSPDTELREAGRTLIALRYFRRFMDEVAVHEDEREARDEGAAHA